MLLLFCVKTWTISTRILEKYAQICHGNRGKINVYYVYHIYYAYKLRKLS